MRFWVNGGDNMSPKNLLLSAIIIAKNEEARIKKCVDSLAFADEILVIDNGSTDHTAEIAKKQGALVHATHVNDFSKLRNDAAYKAYGTWILYIDADEFVTPELAADITRVIQSWNEGEPEGYEVCRKNYYLGKLWPTDEWMLRLFRRDAMEPWKGKLHESPGVRGPVGRLSGKLLHDTHRMLFEMVTKTNEWSGHEARLRFEARHPAVTWWRLLRVMGTGFWESFIRQSGWRAGTVGWIESVYQGFSMFITYAKLWEMQQKRST